MALKLMTVDDSRTIRRIVSAYAKALGPDVEIMEVRDLAQAFALLSGMREPDPTF